MAGKSDKYPLWRRLVKFVLWTAMACVLAVWGALVCCVNVLKPDNLTRIVEYAANRILDADVSVGQVELRLRESFPFLTVDVDSLTVISRQMKRLPAVDRERLPAYADTILCLDGFSGGINIMALATNEISLCDVTFERLGINLAVLDERVNNYAVYVSPDTASVISEDADTAMVMPRISINRFRLIDSRPIRYYDASAGQELCVRLSNVDVDGVDAPEYRISVEGSLSAPFLDMLKSDSLDLGFNGRIAWTPEQPERIAMSDVGLEAGFISAKGNLSLTMSPDFVVDDMDISIAPIAMETVFSLMPDSMMREWGLDGAFGSDVSLAMSAELTAPFDLAVDSVPFADVRVVLSPGYLKCGRMRFERFGGDVSARLRGNDIDKAVVTVRNVVIAGPATDIRIDGSASDLLSDPSFDVKFKGFSDLRKLPPVLIKMTGGDISGTINADIEAKGRPSMFSRNRFHRLHVVGDIDGTDLRYVAYDTLSRFYVHSACLKFGTNQSFTRGERSVDSLLSVSVSLDSVAVFTPDVQAYATDAVFGIGASNKALSDDTTAIIPMGAGVRIGSLRMNMPSDSIAARTKNVRGMVSVRRYEDDAHRPELRLNLSSDRLALGSASSRMTLRQAEIRASMAKLERKQREIPAAVIKLADSISAVHPGLPMDSVYRLAFRERRRRMGRNPDALTNEESELIDWGVSKPLRRLLLGWDIRGSVKAGRARLTTPYFPLRNRIRNFNLAFTNDSIVLDSISYKAGHSDFLISGSISNMKRGFTSRSGRQPVKMSLKVVSDTIEVNQLADAAFTGAAYSAALEKGLVDNSMSAAISNVDAGFDDDDDDAMTMTADTVAPLLIPTNIEGIVRMKADNIIYSDLLLHKFRGTLQLYDGAVNLSRLAASSDLGSMELSALYSAPNADNMKFGFGMLVDGFKIDRFMTLMPALDSIMPLMRDFSGTINADVAATVDIDRNMDLVLPTLDAAVHLAGDSLTIIDPETFKVISKWLMFKDKNRNVIDHMDVQLTVHDNVMRMYPFVFDFDRYRLGVQGSNDLAMNFDYHVAVLKSPIPFKFGLNISGNADDYKIRLGKARLNEKTAVVRDLVVDTARINLVKQIENVFRRGVRKSRFATVNVGNRGVESESVDVYSDTISHADSLLLINEGLITDMPAERNGVTSTSPQAVKKNKKKGSGKQGKSSEAAVAVEPSSTEETRDDK